MAVHGGELAAAMTFKHTSREGEGLHLGGVWILEGLGRGVRNLGEERGGGRRENEEEERRGTTETLEY